MPEPLAMYVILPVKMIAPENDVLDAILKLETGLDRWICRPAPLLAGLSARQIAAFHWEPKLVVAWKPPA